KITREQMDEFSLWSHRKAIRAIDEGRFKKEIEPVPVFDEGGNKRMFDTDEHPRRTTSVEKLASLPPAFKPDGRMTAGHSSGFDDAKLNVNGGAIALGHPLGMSGARLITTMLHEMERQDLHYGLASLCIGFGMGLATIIERPT